MSFNVKENKNQINIRFSSQREWIKRVTDEVQIFFHQLQLEEQYVSKLNLVIQELLKNAIMHGNNCEPNTKVQCIVEHLGDHLFKIVVKDQGEGFHYQDMNWEDHGDSDYIGSGGLALVHTLSKQVKFNKKGNQVTVYLESEKNSPFNVGEEEKDNCLVITPRGNFTAEHRNPFRILLEKLLGKGYNRFRLDFHNVHDIDSMVLLLLVLFAKKVVEHGNGHLQVVNVNKDLQQFFHLTRLDQTFRVHGTN